MSRTEGILTIQSIVWILTVVLYLIINFSTGAWAVSWLLFIIASVINKIIASASS